MNEQTVAKKMIVFIEKIERELQANKMNAENHAKSDVVKAILDELERETSNEDN